MATADRRQHRNGRVTSLGLRVDIDRAAAAAAGGADESCSDADSVQSAPQSRSASFRRLRRVADSDVTARASLPSLEDSIVAKLHQLRLLEEQQCCVVRQFVTSPRGSVVNRGDSFRQHAAARQDKQPRQARDHPLSRFLSVDKPHTVLILGDRAVGKTCLLQQLMTSQYMAAMDSSHFGLVDDESKVISVSLNSEETLINLIDVQTSLLQQQEREFSELLNAADCLILLFSITDRKSFHFVVDLLTDIRRHQHSTQHQPRVSTAVPAGSPSPPPLTGSPHQFTPRSNATCIVVANKSDLVRKRQVTDREAREVCVRHASKYLNMSAVLNHRVDDLLVGVVQQLRLQQTHETRSSSADPEAAAAGGCGFNGKGLVQRLLFSHHKDRVKRCENFTVL